MKRYIAALALTAVLPTASFAADHPHADAIEARQGFMEVLKFNMGILGAMAKGKVDYDAAQASAAANNLAAAAKMENGAMWPEGSDNSNPALKDITEALPEGWSEYAKIAEVQKKWVAATEKLAAAAGTGVGGIRANIGDVGKSCKGCHDIARKD